MGKRGSIQIHEVSQSIVEVVYIVVEYVDWSLSLEGDGDSLNGGLVVIVATELNIGRGVVVLYQNEVVYT